MDIIEHPTPEQQRAVYAAFKSALRHGDIVKPACCAWCGETRLRIHGHHPDYARPLMVVWLCGRCHRKHHAKHSDDRFFSGRL